MALKVGSLYVSLAASTGAFIKGMGDASRAVEKFSKDAKKAAGDVAQISGTLAAVGAAAIKLAAGVDGPTKKAMGGLEKSSQLLAVQIADMLLPAVRELSRMFREAAAWVAGLDPALKKQIAGLAVIAVQAFAAAKAFQVFAGAVGLLASLGSAISSGLGAAVKLLGSLSVSTSAFGVSLGPVLGPLLAIVAAVALVVGAVVLLHRAWRKNWGGIQESTGEVLNWLRDGFQQFAGFMGKVWDFVIDGAARFVESILSSIDALQELTGKKLINTGALREGFAGLWKDLKSGSFFSEAFKFGKTVGGQLVDGIAEEFKAIASELGIDKLIAKVRGVANSRGTPIQPRGAAGPVRSGGYGDAGTLTEASRGAVNVRAFVDQVEAAARATSLENVASEQLRQEMKRRAAAEKEAGASADRMLNARATGNTRGLNKAERRDFAAQNSAVISEAVGAGTWSEAQKKLSEGLKGAYSFGAELSTWGARMGPMIASAGQQLLGAVGDLVGSIVEGAQSGGVWGAIIAAFMEIAKKTASALAFLDVAMEFVEQIAAMVEPLVKPIFDALTNVLGIVVQIVEPVFAALVPVFEFIGSLLNKLSPILYAIGDVLQGVAPILEVIGKVLGVVLDALGPVFDLISGILKVVASVLLGIVIALNELAAAFGDTAARAEADKLKTVMVKMWNRTGDLAEAEGAAAGAALRNAAAQDEAADSARKIGESLSNVPTGWRLANARYAADLGITGSNAFAGAGAGGGGSTTIINGDVNVTSTAETVEDLAMDAKKERARDRAQRTGNRYGGRGGGSDL